MNLSSDSSQRATNLVPFPSHWHSLAHAFVHQVKSKPRAQAVSDSIGLSFTYEQLFIRAVALANLLMEKIDSSHRVGVLLPPSVGAVIANLALTLIGITTVNLNYTVGQDRFNSCLKQCELKHVISARLVIEKLKLKPDATVLYLEDLQMEADVLDKVKSWLEAKLLPEVILGQLLPGLAAETSKTLSDPWQASSDPTTIIFTAGSTAEPKGVLLSHRNILSNIHAISQQGHIRTGEVVLGVIPFFHSFGLTMTLWACLCLGESVIYHYDPFDARRIADLCDKFQATTLICTPTMMATYIRRCKPEQFSSLRHCILGGEKLMRQQAIEIQNKLGLTPLEGYGLAETSPVIACNVPGNVVLSDGRTVSGTKLGTVGLPVPGTLIKISDLDTHQDLPPTKEGGISVHGPQVMIGYLNKPKETEAVLKDGWFTTGDIGFLDEDGFLTVTGRLSQFSKIAGEMVPHLAIEEELLRLTGKDAQNLCVTSVPDAKRGERLVVVHCNLDETPEKLVKRLSESNLPKLWIPDSRDFLQVDVLPTLANGKLDLRKIRELVLQDSSSRTS
jgi:acyl-[acyl-carrier-protein]-phospholipid O-acyltransferase/long-chain-fatty-acid--[acyl-carrier-protein] ligase